MVDRSKELSSKNRLHPRSKHREQYDFEVLTQCCPDLAQHITQSKKGTATIDFFDPEAVKQLNKALLLHFYDLEYWDIPQGYLCPPVPGRADYVHSAADVLGGDLGRIPTGKNIVCLDIGVGSNCIYPIVGRAEYGWLFIGTDIDEHALASAEKIVHRNPALTGAVELRLQSSMSACFEGALEPGEIIDISICNPPFHGSRAEAEKGSLRKLSNLKRKHVTVSTLNFGGTGNELWTQGGERGFIQRMIQESVDFSKRCYWFSSLVSRQSNLKPIDHMLDQAGVEDRVVMELGQGQKSSRAVFWTFLNEKQQRAWRDLRWS